MLTRMNSLSAIRNLLYMIMRIQTVSGIQECRYSTPFLHQLSSNHKNSTQRVVHFGVIDEISFGKLTNKKTNPCPKSALSKEINTELELI